MSEVVARYYVGEQHTAMLGVSVGVLLLVLAAIVWRRRRSMAYTLVIGGVVLGAASGAYIPISGARADEAIAKYRNQSDRSIAEAEAARVQAALSDFTTPIAIDAGVVLVGLFLALASKRKNIGYALMIIGLAASSIEAVSIQKHLRYRSALG